MLSFLKHDVKFISADTVKNRIMKLFEEKQQLLKEYIESNESMFSLTTDIWTSPANVSFMAVTVHFINNEWQIVSFVLDFVAFPGNHGGKEISKACREILEEYNLKNRILALTTDNATNNDIFIQDLLDKQYLDSIESHQRCFAHVLNLSAQMALGEIKTSVDNLRILIKAVRVSPKRSQKFKEICAEMGIKHAKPVLDVVTRWNSTADMLTRSIQLKKALKRMSEILVEEGEMEKGLQISYINTNFSLEIEQSEWVDFEVINSLLKPFREATLEVCGDHCATISLVVPWYNEILDHIENTQV